MIRWKNSVAAAPFANRDHPCILCAFVAMLLSKHRQCKFMNTVQLGKILRQNDYGKYKPYKKVASSKNSKTCGDDGSQGEQNQQFQYYTELSYISLNSFTEIIDFCSAKWRKFKDFLIYSHFGSYLSLKCCNFHITKGLFYKYWIIKNNILGFKFCSFTKPTL